MHIIIIIINKAILQRQNEYSGKQQKTEIHNEPTFNIICKSHTDRDEQKQQTKSDCNADSASLKRIGIDKINEILNGLYDSGETSEDLSRPILIAMQ